MQTCEKCGSPEINPGKRGRPRGEWIGLCDVCYWRSKFIDRAAERQLARMPEELVAGLREVLSYAHNGVVEHDASILRDILAWQESLK